MKEIKDLIKNYEWPGIDSVTFQDGKMVILSVNFYDNYQYSIKPRFDSTINSFLKYDDTDLSIFDVYAKVNYKDYEVFAGGGSYEGEGVIYVINKISNTLYWFTFFENSDSFKKVDVRESGVIEATTENKVIYKIPIDNPLGIELIHPA